MHPGVLCENHQAGCPSEQWCVLGSALLSALLGVMHWHPLGEENQAELVLMQGHPGACGIRYGRAFPSFTVLQSSRWSLLNSCLSCRCSPLNQQYLPALGALHQRHQPGRLQLKARRHAPALLLRLQRGPVERGRGCPWQLPQPL